MRLLPLTLAIGLLPGAPLGAKESPPPPLVAVLDFATAEDIAWLGAGFSATLAARLDLVVSLRVADPFETRGAARCRSVVADDNAQVQAFGQELSADYVLTGHILREETNLTITAWLVNVKTGRRQGEQKLPGRQDALFALQNQFLAGWLRPLRLKLSKEEEARVAAYLPTESLLAFEFFGRGLAQYNPDRPLEALGIWEQAVEFDPNFALAREAQGRAAYRYQELLYEQALQQYQQALALTPDNARLHYLLALAYYDRRRFDDALKELQEALRLKPNYLEAHYQLGLLYLSGLNRPAEAAQSFNAVLVIEPTHVRALNNLGVALWQSNHREEARAAWQEVLRHDPDNPSAQENLRRFGR